MHKSGLAEHLLRWHDHHKRILPWQADNDPYRVWVREIMLQQTTVAVVKDYYRAFLLRWPRLESFAAASRDEVLHFWQGLGYYRRAHNMHQTAQVVWRQHGGRFPDDEKQLRRLAGIGAYTAAALCAFAFGKPCFPLDSHGLRILARLYACEQPLPQARRLLQSYGNALMPSQRCGAIAQAFMDLGALICKQRNPLCGACPLRSFCCAYQQSRVEAYPYRPERRQRPVRYAVFFWLENDAGAYLIYRRPHNGLLAGLWECPSTPWRETPWQDDDWQDHAPKVGNGHQKIDWHHLVGDVRHVFTHFTLYGRLVYARVGVRGWRAEQAEMLWIACGDEKNYALSTLMRKLVTHKHKVTDKMVNEA